MNNSNTIESGGNPQIVNALPGAGQNTQSIEQDFVPEPADSEEPQPIPVATETAPAAISAAVAKELAIFEEARVTQTVEEFEGGRKLVEQIPVRRPQKTTWFRSHPDKSYWYRAFLIEDERTGDVYFLARSVWESLLELGEKAIARKLLVPTMSRNGVLALWPINLGTDGTLSSWAESALTAVVTARKEWVRVTSNKEMGGYDIKAREPDGVEPKWPDMTVSEVLRIAFKGRVIDTLDHPIIKDLQGKAASGHSEERLNTLLEQAND